MAPILPASPLEARPGTYVLVLSRDGGPTRVRVGRLGTLVVERGVYLYVGSALGPGGLRGRVGHHRRPVIRPRWHIDYLRSEAREEGLWFVYDRRRLEHDWAKVLKGMPGARIPLVGFGASDCGCPSHLFFFDHRSPSRRGFEAALARAGAAGPRLRISTTL